MPRKDRRGFRESALEALGRRTLSAAVFGGQGSRPMAALGDNTWKRKDQTPQDDLATSDSYGTGFYVDVLQLAGEVPADDSRIRRAVAWLREHHRKSSYWYARSPKGNDRLSTYVGTAYVVLALRQCGEIP
jgi:hypothetical protein